MSLLAYNKTAAPLALAAGSPIVTLPAASSAGARGPAMNVTGELIGANSAAFALLQAQVAAGQIDYEWTTLPEFNTFTLVVGSAAGEFAENVQSIYVGDWSLLGGGVGSDSNPGTLAAPLATLTKAEQVQPSINEAPVLIRMANQAFAAPTQWFQGSFRGPGSAPRAYVGTMTDQLGSQAAAAGTTAKQIISSSSPVFRSGAVASITAITGNGQSRTMTVTGMTGLVAADVGKNFWFALASNKSTANLGTTSVTFGAPTAAGLQTLSGLTGGLFATTSVGNFVLVSGAANAANNGLKQIRAFVSATSVTVYNPTGIAEGPTASVAWQEQGLQSHETGNNGMFKMAALISATSATFYNAQALVENTNVIYWQDCFRGDWLHFTSGAAGLLNAGGLCITDHGERARATVDLTGVPTAGDTLVINDGTNAAVTFTWRAAPAVANEVLIGGTAAESLTNLIGVINQNNPNSGATPLRVRMYHETSTRGRLVNMLTGSVGNTATPTKTGVWTPTIVTFATAAAGVGAPTTTFTLNVTGFGANVPAVGNTFVVEKNGTFIDCPANMQLHAEWPLFMNLRLRAVTAGSFMLKFGTPVAAYQLSIEANQSAAVQIFAGAVLGAAIQNVVYANTGLLPSGLGFFPTIYITSATFNMNTGVAVAAFVIDHSSMIISGFARYGSGNIDARRTSASISAAGSSFAALGANARMLGTLNTADAAAINASFNGEVIGQTGATTGAEVSYSSGYGILLSESVLQVAQLSGVGNAIAGVRVNNVSRGQIDAIAGTTTSATGELGDVEFGHENTPLIQTYATIRTADGTGTKGYQDTHMNRVDVP